MMIAWLLLTAFAASYVRAFTGFGAALVAVPALVLILPPSDAVPLAMALDLCVGFLLLGNVIRTGIVWKPVKLLIIAALLSMPFGVWTLHVISPRFAYLAIAVIVFAFTSFLALGFRAKRNPGTLTTLIAGSLSGILGGAFGMTGPPVVLFFFSSPMGKEISRATIMAYIIVTTAAYLLLTAATRISVGWLRPLFLMLPFIVLGTYLGQKTFFKTEEKTFRRVVYGLLYCLSVSAACKAWLG
jgi:uncharacterized protein